MMVLSRQFGKRGDVRGRWFRNAMRSAECHETLKHLQFLFRKIFNRRVIGDVPHVRRISKATRLTGLPAVTISAPSHLRTFDHHLLASCKNLLLVDACIGTGADCRHIAQHVGRHVQERVVVH